MGKRKKFIIKNIRNKKHLLRDGWKISQKNWRGRFPEWSGPERQQSQFPSFFLGTYYLGTYYQDTYYLGTYYLGTYYLGTYYLGTYYLGTNYLGTNYLGT